MSEIKELRYVYEEQEKALMTLYGATLLYKRIICAELMSLPVEIRKQVENYCQNVIRIEMTLDKWRAITSADFQRLNGGKR